MRALVDLFFAPYRYWRHLRTTLPRKGHCYWCDEPIEPDERVCEKCFERTAL